MIVAEFQKPVPEQELRTPTFGELLEVYPQLAEDERQRTGGRPCRRREQNNARAMKLMLKILGWSLDRPYTDLTTRVLDKLFIELKSRGFEPISAKTYLQACVGVVAKWTLFRYEEYGYKVQGIKLPSMYVPPKRYRELPVAKKKKILDAYNALESTDPEAWFFATMMLQFGMRNSDVRRLTWNSFQEESDGVYLTYTPHKTRLSSNRIVHWPVDDGTWKKILKYKETHPDAPFIHISPYGVSQKSAERRLNLALRQAGVDTYKCAYELRKLCACAVYKHFGQEAASSLLGDDIKTVLFHYADPSTIGHKVDMLTLI